MSVEKVLDRVCVGTRYTDDEVEPRNAFEYVQDVYRGRALPTLGECEPRSRPCSSKRPALASSPRPTARTSRRFSIVRSNAAMGSER